MSRLEVFQKKVRWAYKELDANGRVVSESDGFKTHRAAINHWENKHDYSLPIYLCDE